MPSPLSGKTLIPGYNTMPEHTPGKFTRHKPAATKPRPMPASGSGAKPFAKPSIRPRTFPRKSMPLTTLNFSMVCKKLAPSLTETQTTQLARYMDLLMRWNKAMNLVGTASWEETLSELFVDSFYLSPFLAEHTQNWPAFTVYDVGAGAGLPGIPLRILWQEGEYFLLEAREKRALFLQNVLAQMALPKTMALQGRAETILKPRAQEDNPLLFLSRAFMPWQDALAFFTPFSAPGDKAVFLLNTPPHDTELWKTTGNISYTVGQKKRYIHIFTRV